MIQRSKTSHDPGGKPFVLIVDDFPDDVRNKMINAFDGRADIEVLHPSDIDTADLERANLVLVDYKLDDWSGRDRQDAPFRIQTGLALATVLRELVDQKPAGPGGTPPSTQRAAFALHTARLAEAKGRIRLPSSSARHVLARLNNLEWVFEKQDSRRVEQMLELARATRKLPAEWPSDPRDSESQAERLLGLAEGIGWYERCWRDVRECQPPIHELAGGAGSVLFLRWLLHQILPFPSFLWDEHWLAARLRLRLDDLRKLLVSDSALRRDLNDRRYSGLLADFLGDRWWRGAIEDYVWQLTAGSSGDSGEFGIALREKAGKELDLLEISRPVVCLDENLQPSGRFTSPSDAVNVRPDHWPAFAESAWMRISTVEEVPEMRAIVDPLDEYRIA
ncbi:hypothetical protein [Candidatus Palauibacter polyketidifaciens]|uniref:hypothetical protein n=1 Tax=Candidatus Palauibacter polyketidifaciens TaxID=3056740 RepID=UPI00239E3F2D|nr:hypothetical protein [Candidatus Palauibacter polyketidifaciens]MDE2719527.1 hypothetical protein [Candidatus Palauibacter polyketidifaciens]